MADGFPVTAGSGTTIATDDIGGDMTVDNVVFAAGQSYTVTGFTITTGNA